MRYYSITEAARMVGEDPSTLRYWEEYFGKPKPRRDNALRRQYSDEDIEILKIIKKLVREDGLHLDKAKEKLYMILSMKGQLSLPLSMNFDRYTLLFVKKELEDILKFLKEH